MGQIYLAPLQNYIQKSLNGAIDDSQATITLSSTTNLQAPGVVVVDRVDSSGNELAAALREVIYYTGISSNDLTGCTRGGDGSTAQLHGDQAVVETMPTVGMWNGLATTVGAAMDINGYLRAISSPASIQQLQSRFVAVTSIASIGRIQAGELALSSAASVGQLFVSNRVDVSAASVTGIGLFPVFRGSGAFSGATTAVGGLLIVPKAGNFNWFSVVTRTVASGASVVFDFMKNGTSVFAGVTKPTIVGGGTFISTASINTKNFAAGDILRFDVNSNTVGLITDIVGQGRAD